MGIIRLLLALSVVVSHCGNIGIFSFIGGRTAVESFYIISGFYMSLIINEKYIGKNNSFKLFITNRFLRLYPIYWTVLIITTLVYIACGLIFKNHYYPTFCLYGTVFPNVGSFFYLILTNIIIFGQDLVMFMGINPVNGHLYLTTNFWNTNPQLWLFMLVPQAWTLGIELTFYLIAPFIIKRGLKLVVPLIILSLLLRFYLYNFQNLNFDPWTYRFFPTEIFFFLLGYLSYRLSVKLKTLPVKKIHGYLVLVLIISLTFIYPWIPETQFSFSLFQLKDILYFAFIAMGMPVLFTVFKKSKLDNKIGELSYPVYISHMLVYFVLTTLPFYFLRNGIWAAVATIIFSFILNRFIAEPIEKYRQSRLTK